MCVGLLFQAKEGLALFSILTQWLYITSPLISGKSLLQ